MFFFLFFIRDSTMISQIDRVAFNNKLDPFIYVYLYYDVE